MTGRKDRDRGAVAVEFALVVPLLLLLVFAIASYGYMLSFRQSISQAAAEAARAAAVAPGGLAATDRKARALAAMNSALGSYDVSCGTDNVLRRGTRAAGTCSISNPQACSTPTTLSQCVKVTISYAYDDEPLLPDVGIGVVLPDDLAYSTEAQVS